ncbi:hypothetical protein ES707_18361 [subsurface metagenome]
MVLVRYDGRDIQAVTGSTGNLILGIVNRQHENATYFIRVMINEELVKVYLDKDELDKIGPIELTHEETWEHEIGFAPRHVGDNQKVEFILYKNGVPYFENPPHLQIDVREQD